jgi:hypothetical protein
MPLRAARLTGDPILENCLNNTSRLQSGDDGLSVKRLQAGLLALGRAVGPGGDDGVFGNSTVQAVVQFKSDKGLVPAADGIVGPGTARALDDDLFVDPAVLDPAFAEFSPHVVSHLLEQFVAIELSALLDAPLDSFRHMLGSFALTSLSSGHLLGIVAKSRGTDLKSPFLSVADALQTDPRFGLVAAESFFDDALNLGGAAAITVTFTVLGVPRSFIVIHDTVVLGRAAIDRQSTGKKAKETLQSVVVHELTHARNIAGTIDLMSKLDSDPETYSDVDLAASSSAAGRPTGDSLRSFVHEMTARHVEWIVLKELAGTPGAIAVNALEASKLAAAAWFYFVDTGLFHANGYVPAIKLKANEFKFDQLAKWLAICATQSFSDDPEDNERSVLAFQAAAQFCSEKVASPTPLDAADADGLFPLPNDFN